MNYAEAIEYIHSVNWTFCKPGLERVSELCRRLGDPQDSLKFIHVAGTNGKGSFCAMTDSILRHAGYKVGLFTSPYIVEFNERMRINGENISDAELCNLVEEIKPIADQMTDKPTEFELITAIAFLYFARNNCDVVVLAFGALFGEISGEGRLPVTDKFRLRMECNLIVNQSFICAINCNLSPWPLSFRRALGSPSGRAVAKRLRG